MDAFTQTGLAADAKHMWTESTGLKPCLGCDKLIDYRIFEIHTEVCKQMQNYECSKCSPSVKSLNKKYENEYNALVYDVVRNLLCLQNGTSPNLMTMAKLGSSKDTPCFDSASRSKAILLKLHGRAINLPTLEQYARKASATANRGDHIEY